MTGFSKQKDLLPDTEYLEETFKDQILNNVKKKTILMKTSSH